MRILALGLLAILAGAPAPAGAAPRVVATIAPVHSLVAQVMGGAGAPDLLLPAGVSEHDQALRPSQAALLARADLVVRVGAGLERGLDGPLAALAGRAVVLDLAQAPGVETLAVREGALFDGHDHDDHAQTAKAAEAEAGHDDHAIDPHLWLDPANARAWVDAIAVALGDLDPANANTYRANADMAKTNLTALQAEIAATVAPHRGKPFVVFHDAYHYFEHRFEIEAVAAVALNDATLPGAQRLAQIRARLAQTGAACVFAEPQLPPALVATVADGTGARTGVLDPLGAGLAPGPALYPALLRGLAAALAACLG